MSTITWPAILQDCPLLQPYNEKPNDNRLMTEVQSGPPKIRALSTVTSTDTTVAIIMTDSETIALDTFYRETTSFGSVEFEWLHPRTREVVECQFMSVPSLDPLGNGKWLATFEMKILP